MSERSTLPALADLPDPAALHRLLRQIRQHTLSHLDLYLEELAENVTAQAGRVHFAADVAAAREILGALLRSGEPDSVKLQEEPLCGQMRQTLQQCRFEQRGGSGGEGLNVFSPELAIAETGQLCVLAPESGGPHEGPTIAVCRLDQVVPRLADLAVVLKWVSRQATGRAMPPAVRLIGAEAASLDLILIARQTEPSWVTRLWNRLRGENLPTTDADWLTVLGRSLATPPTWERWERRS